MRGREFLDLAREIVLGPHVRHGSEAAARQSIRQAADALTLLDALDADPARLAAAVSSIQP
jgi:hypothetical protein